MNIKEYGEMYKLESFYWWFVARRRLLESMMQHVAGEYKAPLIMDVGCGTGINFSLLSKFGKTISIDESQDALMFSKNRGSTCIVRSEIELLPFQSSKFDIITALDVLEHVDDDLKAMEELFRVIKKDGVLLITVPAYGFLWSEHDEALHHRRRYTASELRNKLANCGLEVERLTYYITFLFFPILFMRFAQSLFKKSVRAKTSHIILPKWLNSLLIGVLGLERHLLRWINFPFGVSIVCLVRKTFEGASLSDGHERKREPNRAKSRMRFGQMETRLNHTRSQG